MSELARVALPVEKIRTTAQPHHRFSVLFRFDFFKRLLLLGDPKSSYICNGGLA
jgi:hypothetical protein